MNELLIDFTDFLSHNDRALPEKNNNNNDENEQNKIRHNNYNNPKLI